MQLLTYHDYDYKETAQAVKGGNMDISLILQISAVVLLAVLLTVAIICMIKINRIRNSLDNMCIRMGNIETNNNQTNLGVVFCKKCKNSYDAGKTACPFCGTKK